MSWKNPPPYSLLLRYLGNDWFSVPLTVIAGIALAFWSWGKWPDVFVDFGRELYVPWQITQGKVLYGDIAYFNGPLSAYFNALAFSVFGSSLRTLVWVNLTILAMVSSLIYIGLKRLGGSLSALVGSLGFLTIFAFAQLTSIGNFNFVTPYSHEITHGIFLSFLLLLCLDRFLTRRSLLAVTAMGFLLGLIFLTKAEIMIAAAAAAATGLVADCWVQRNSRTQLARSMAVMCLVAVLPPLLATAALWGPLPIGESLQGILGSWRHLLTPELHALYFYRWGFGLDALHQNLVITLKWALASILFICLGILVGKVAQGSGRLRTPVTAGSSLLAFGLLYWNADSIPWGEIGKPLPLLLFSGICLVAVRVWKLRQGCAPNSRAVMALSFLVFAFLLLLKMIFNTRLHQYGFALAMPGTLLVLLAATSTIPEWLRSRGGDALAFRAIALAVIAAVAIIHLQQTADYFSTKTVPVGNGGDRFIADSRGRFANRVLDLVSNRLTPADTLAVLPEGVMINYLSRRPNSTPYINFMPPELIIFREEPMVAAFDAAPPDYILFTNRGAADYGLRMMGRDYGLQLADWIRRNYVIDQEIREPSIVGEEYSFGVLMRHR